MPLSCFERRKAMRRDRTPPRGCAYSHSGVVREVSISMGAHRAHVRGTYGARQGATLLKPFTVPGTAVRCQARTR